MVACGGSAPEPEIASSAGEAGYAANYAADLEGVASRFGKGEVAAKEAHGEFRGYPDQLKTGDHARAKEIVARADAAGRSHSYVDGVREVAAAESFFEREGEEITKKVAGASQYVAKQKGCDVDVSGAASNALKESIAKQAEKRLRERNEGHLLLERYRGSLSKEGAAALEKQADQIAHTSYLVHVALVEEKIRLGRMIEEGEQIKKTADEYVRMEREWQGDPKRKEAEKKESEARIQAMQEGKARVDSALTQARSLHEKLEPRLEELKKSHADAIRALLDALETEAKKSSG